MNQNGIIRKSAGIVIENKKILVEKSKNRDYYVSPGGKMVNHRKML